MMKSWIRDLEDSIPDILRGGKDMYVQFINTRQMFYYDITTQ